MLSEHLITRILIFKKTEMKTEEARTIECVKNTCLFDEKCNISWIESNFTIFSTVFSQWIFKHTIKCRKHNENSGNIQNDFKCFKHEATFHFWLNSQEKEKHEKRKISHFYWFFHRKAKRIFTNILNVKNVTHYIYYINEQECMFFFEFKVWYRFICSQCISYVKLTYSCSTSTVKKNCTPLDLSNRYKIHDLRCYFRNVTKLRTREGNGFFEKKKKFNHTWEAVDYLEI